MKPKRICITLAFCVPCAIAEAQCVGAEAQLHSVSKALAVEDGAKATQILDSLEKLHPGCPEISLDRGRIYFLNGDASNAEIAFNRYTELAPDDSKGYARLAQAYLDEQRYPRADAASLKAMDKNPIDPSALAVRGQIMGMKGDRDEGIRMLEIACRLDPSDAESHYQLGALYASVKRRGDAAKEFEKTLELVPDNASAWDYLALNLETLGEADRADEAYRKAEVVNHAGRHYDGFLDYNFGRFLAKRNQLKEAKQHLDRAVEAAPEVRAVWYERAKANMSLRDYPAARADAEKAESLPDARGVILDLQMYTLLGEIYRRLGEKELADKYADLCKQTPGSVQQTRSN